MMKNLQAALKSTVKQLRNVERDARYLVALLWSVPLFLLTWVQALNNGWFDSLEKPVFYFFNDLPSWVGAPMYVFTQLGSLTGLLIWMGLAWYIINRRAAYTVFVAGLSGWILAKLVKAHVARGRPEAFFDKINLFQDNMYTGFGFPSGHSTLSAACATVLFYQVKPSYRKHVLLVVLLVGVSRMYLGAHFPLDVVGGWALGVMCGSLAVLIVGRSVKQLSANQIKRALRRKGFEARSVRFANVDARGSRPVVIEDTTGRQYFGKIFGEQEHAADWLFKLYRFFRYKNLQAEEPYINGRRNVELESFANLWAKKVGIRTADIIDIVKVGRNWLLVQDKIDAQPFPDVKRLKTSTLEDAWRQVAKLHAGNMAHRDLRAANLMVDKSGQVWIIDFGFAEVSPNKSRKSMDIAELLMSMTLLVGVKRTVGAASKIMDAEDLRRALAYVHRSVFSGATNQLLRGQKDLLKELQSTLKEKLKVEGELKPASIDRINAKRLLSIGLLAVFAYVIVPQFTEFRGALGALEHVRLGWLVPVFVFSLLTYVSAGGVFVALASIPLRLRDTTLVQLAGSFMSKIVPAGVGSTGINARFLSKAGLDATETSALILGQNVIGFLMFVLPLGILLLVKGQSIDTLFDVEVDGKVLLLAVGLILMGLAVVIASKKLRTQSKEFTVRLISSLRDLSTSPREIALAGGASLGITLFYVACLYSSIHAFHATLSFSTALFIYATAMIAKAVVPTPGGLGPVEVAISAALVGTGLPPAQAFAIVILYRFATFWLPIPFSLLAYRHLTSRDVV